MTNQVETPSNTESNEIISFDVVLREIGEFGRYQIINGILTCLVIAISTCALFNFVFSAAIPDHRFVYIFISKIPFQIEIFLDVSFRNVN